MIKCHLSRLMGEKKLKISHVSKETQINRGTITRLYNESYQRVEKDVVNQLCIFLDCRIEDLFEYIPDDNES